MKRLALCLVLIGGGLGMSAQSTLACTNDRETRVHENQFKSDYIKVGWPSEDYTPPAPEVGYSLGSAGLLMLSVAAVVVYRRKSKPGAASHDKPHVDKAHVHQADEEQT